MSSPALLPVELIYLIIDYLHTDRQALKACSRVCRAWLPAGRRYLFETISLAFHFESEIQRSYKLPRLLSSPLCTISPYVRRVNLMDLGETVMSEALRNMRFSTLSAVRTLEIESSTLMDSDVDVLISNFNSIEVLVFRAVATSIDFGRVVAHFPKMTALTLNIFEWTPVRSMHPPPIYLQRLALSSETVTLNDIFAWLAGVRHAHLRTLELFDIGYASLPALGTFLRQIPELHHLVLDLSLISAHNDDLSDLHASMVSTDSLRTLTLRDAFMGARQATVSALPALLASLSRSPPPALEVLTLELHNSIGIPISALPWLAVGTALQADRLPRLRAVVIRVHIVQPTDVEPASSARFIRTALSALNARGILTVSVS